MIMQIIIGVIALAFVVLVIFAILALQDLRKALKKTDKVLTDVHKALGPVSEASVDLLHNVNKLIHPRSREHHADGKRDNEKISEIIECVADGVRLFNKIKDGIKAYGRAR